jgi:DNA-binding NarL/FixJ family response regulator
MVRVLVVDDHEVVRRGLASLFLGTAVEIVAVASTAAEALETVKQTEVDVVLLDVRLPDQDGLETLRKLKAERAEQVVVMLSSFDNPTYVARSVALGASDYVLKMAARADIIEAIERAGRGDPPADRSLLHRIRSDMSQRRDARSDNTPLTNREFQVLRHVALGLSNREIGAALGISVETVKEHVQNILRKLNVGDRTQAAVWAVRRELV